MTVILNLRGDASDDRKIRKAAKMIRDGGVVVFPTETVYGIGANALDAKAALRIFKIKRRPSDNPLIVHVSDMKMLNEVVEVPERYRHIIDRILPAPLTIRMKARKQLPSAVTGGLDSISVRMPDDKVALKLIHYSGVPIAAPSANISKMPSSTRAWHAKKYFYGKVDAILAGKPSKFGLESTILELDKFVLARPGAFTKERIEKEFGRKVRITKVTRGIKDAAKATTPGLKYKHYSPNTPLFMFTGKISLLPGIARGSGRFVFIGSSESCKTMRHVARSTIDLGSREDLWEIGANLFDGLINLDSKDAEFAITEQYPEEGIGSAIMNRLRKACSRRYFRNRAQLIKLTDKVG